MAVTATLLTQGSLELAGSAASWNSAAFTPANNSLLVVFVGAINAADSVDVSSAFTVAGASLTYTSRATAGVASGFREQGRVWTAPVTTGVSTTLTFDCGANTLYNPCWAVYQITGHDTTTPTGAVIGTASTTTNGALTVTLSGAPATDSVVVAFVAVDGDTTGTNGVDPGTGWTENGEAGDNTTFSYCQVQQRTGSASTSVTWNDIQTGTMTTFSSVGLAVELKISAGGSTTANAGNSAGTGAANAPSVQITPNAGNAAGTGAARAPTVQATTTAGNAAGTGVARAPSVQLAPSAGNSAGAGAALPPTVQASPGVGNAAGTGVAQTPSVQVIVNAGVAQGVGAALDPTVQTGADTTANAGNAAGTGAAQNPTVQLALNGGNTAGTGAANAPSVQVIVNAGVAQGVGSAGTPSVQVTVNTGTAAGTGTANAPTVQVTVNAGIAAGIGAALPASIPGLSSPGRMAISYDSPTIDISYAAPTIAITYASPTISIDYSEQN